MIYKINYKWKKSYKEYYLKKLLFGSNFFGSTKHFSCFISGTTIFYPNSYFGGNSYFQTISLQRKYSYNIFPIQSSWNKSTQIEPATQFNEKICSFNCVNPITYPKNSKIIPNKILGQDSNAKVKFYLGPPNKESPEKKENLLPIPNLINIQRASFENFIQSGLIKAFETNPMLFGDSNHWFEIVFLVNKMQFRKPEINMIQAIKLGKTYGCPIYLPLIINSSDWKQQRFEWILLGFLPIMTKQGHFLINGIPRVVLYQMVRNPGVYTIPKDSRTRVPTIRIVPEQGSWLNITLDKKNRIWVSTRILRRKVSIIVFLQALGITISEIYHRIEHSEILKYSFVKSLQYDEKTRHDFILIRAGLKTHPNSQEEAWRYLYSHFQEYTSQAREQVITNETAQEFFCKTVWNPKNRNLGAIGRKQFREKLGSNIPIIEIYLNGDDLVLATQALIKLLFGERISDDIDSLNNKRIRGCGEFLQDELLRGLRDFESILTRKLNNTAPGELFNFWKFNKSTLSKSISKAWKSFFTGGNLSQFMDETNPLAETTHKRRLTVLGAGGVNTKQTTIQIRGIHPTYYGRLCPIETPEGQNAGLVNSFTIFAQRDFFGNIETPYFNIYKGQVQTNLSPIYFSPHSESQNILAPADILPSKFNILAETQLPVRKDWKFTYAFWNQIKIQSVGILQMISLATSLIPFLEHDDANRALMGSNMQRQAVPLIRPEVGIVKTGLEVRVVTDVNHTRQVSSSGYLTNVQINTIKLYSPATELNIHSHPKLDFGQYHLIQTSVLHRPRLKHLFSRSSLYDYSLMLNQKFRLQNRFISKIELLRLNNVKRNKQKFWNFKGKIKKSAKIITVHNFIAPVKKEIHSSFASFPSLYHRIKNSGTVMQGPNGFSDKFYLAITLLQLMGINTILNKQKKIFNQIELVKKLTNSFSYPIFNSFKIKLIQNGILDQTNQTEKAHQNETQISLNTTMFQKNKKKLEQVYNLDNYQRTNQSTYILQRPVISEAGWVEKSDIIADGSASYRGKLALGRNVLVAYLPWEGYNFEDAILISERLVTQDLFTSLHIDYYEIEVKNTQYGLENITNKIPIEFDDSAKDIIRTQKLNSDGLIEIGNWVEENDYLVGKVTPVSSKGPSVQQQYEKLYSVIVQRETVTVRNTSLRVPKGVQGFVLDVQILPPKEADVLALAPKNSILRVRIVLIQRRKIQVGDKMAGRHGNKGVISKILPLQDMPYLPDGTPIDIVLNPLGVPSRMNVGQILECLLGLAGKYLQESYNIKLFDEQFGAESSRSLVYSKLYETSIKTINPWLFEPHHPGKLRIFDGRTGNSFDQAVTVGYAHMLKLVHLVDDKIHARATGPYSAVTQQPVRGRSRNGGQRLGEMEVWALQAYGAAYTLQELLTVKSDNVDGRKEAVFRIYTNQSLKFGPPESFKVLIRELQSLCFQLKIYGYDMKIGKTNALNLNNLEKLE